VVHTPLEWALLQLTIPAGQRGAGRGGSQRVLLVTLPYRLLAKSKPAKLSSLHKARSHMTISNNHPTNVNNQNTSPSPLFKQGPRTTPALTVEAKFSAYEQAAGKNSADFKAADWNKFATTQTDVSASVLSDAEGQTKTDDAFNIANVFSDVQGENGKGFSQTEFNEYIKSVDPGLDSDVLAQANELAKNAVYATNTVGASGVSSGTASGS
jgi:hypothetical protein